MFEDRKRNTKLYINTNEKTFQFITPDKNYEIKMTIGMREYCRKILILHQDEEIELMAVVIKSRK